MAKLSKDLIYLGYDLFDLYPEFKAEKGGETHTKTLTHTEVTSPKTKSKVQQDKPKDKNVK